MENSVTIAIFGGSFDPPHIGHEKIVQEALESLHVDKLFIIPTYLSPFKSAYTAKASVRLEWLKKMFKDEPKVEVLDIEVKQKRAVPTIETVNALQETLKPAKIYLIIGADNFVSITKWHRYEELSNKVEFVVAHRAKNTLPGNLKKLPINVNISSSKLREKMDTSYLPASITKEITEYYTKENNEPKN